MENPFRAAIAGRVFIHDPPAIWGAPPPEANPPGKWDDVTLRRAEAVKNGFEPTTDSGYSAGPLTIDTSSRRNSITAEVSKSKGTATSKKDWESSKSPTKRSRTSTVGFRDEYHAEPSEPPGAYVLTDDDSNLGFIFCPQGNLTRDLLMNPKLVEYPPSGGLPHVDVISVRFLEKHCAEGRLIKLPYDSPQTIEYFASVVAQFQLSENRRQVFERNLVELRDRTSQIDDCIFQIYECLNSKTLRTVDGSNVYPKIMETRRDKARPLPSYVNSWRKLVGESVAQLRYFSNLAYWTVMRRNTVLQVWHAMMLYRDDWANDLFSGVDNPDWEVSDDMRDEAKMYHNFNRETQRIFRGIEDDLIIVGRMENNINAFRGGIEKLKQKLLQVKKVYDFPL